MLLLAVPSATALPSTTALAADDPAPQTLDPSAPLEGSGIPRQFSAQRWAYQEVQKVARVASDIATPVLLGLLGSPALLLITPLLTGSPPLAILKPLSPSPSSRGTH